jgi:DNA-binding sugar fermentation-stimulating protein
MAHCANPGSTLGLAEPGAEIWLLASADTKRKLAWSWGLTTSILDKDEPMRSANRIP